MFYANFILITIFPTEFWTSGQKTLGLISPQVSKMVKHRTSQQPYFISWIEAQQQLIWRKKWEKSDSREGDRDKGERHHPSLIFAKAQMHLHTFPSVFIQVFCACPQYLFNIFNIIFIFTYLCKYIFKIFSKYEYSNWTHLILF